MRKNKSWRSDQLLYTLVVFEPITVELSVTFLGTDCWSIVVVVSKIDSVVLLNKTEDVWFLVELEIDGIMVSLWCSMIGEIDVLFWISLNFIVVESAVLLDNSIADNLIEVWLFVENVESKVCLLDSTLASVESDLVISVVSFLVTRELPESVELKNSKHPHLNCNAFIEEFYNVDINYSNCSLRQNTKGRLK